MPAHLKENLFHQGVSIPWISSTNELFNQGFQLTTTVSNHRVLKAVHISISRKVGKSCYIFRNVNVFTGNCYRLDTRWRLYSAISRVVPSASKTLLTLFSVLPWGSVIPTGVGLRLMDLIPSSSRVESSSGWKYSSPFTSVQFLIARKHHRPRQLGRPYCYPIQPMPETRL